MIIFLLRYQQKVTQNYLSKVTNYNYFVTEQHCANLNPSASKEITLRRSKYCVYTFYIFSSIMCDSEFWITSCNLSTSLAVVLARLAMKNQ